MILSARAAGAMAAARLMHPGGATGAAVHLPPAQQQRLAPPQSPYHQQQHQLAGPGMYPAAEAPAARQQGHLDVEIRSQVCVALHHAACVHSCVLFDVDVEVSVRSPELGTDITTLFRLWQGSSGLMPHPLLHRRFKALSLRSAPSFPGNSCQRTYTAAASSAVIHSAPIAVRRPAAGRVPGCGAP